MPESVLTYLFESKLAAVSFNGYGVRPEVAVLFRLLFIHVNCRSKVKRDVVLGSACACIHRTHGVSRR